MKKAFKIALSMLVILLLALPLYAAKQTPSDEIKEEIKSAKETDLTGKEVEEAIKAGKVNTLLNIKFETSFVEFRKRFMDKLEDAEKYADTLVVSDSLYGVKAYNVFVAGLKNKSPRVRIFCAKELAKIYFFKYKKIVADEKWEPKGLPIAKKNLTAARTLFSELIKAETSIPVELMLEKARHLITRILFWKTLNDNVNFLKVISRDTFEAFAVHIDLYPNLTKDKRNHYFRDGIIRSDEKNFNEIKKLLVIPDQVIVVTKEANIKNANIDKDKDEKSLKEEEVKIDYLIDDYNVEIAALASDDYIKLSPIDTFGKDRIEN